MCCGTTPPLCICGADRADRQAATGVTSSEADFASGLSTVLRKSFGSDSRMILAQAEATLLGQWPGGVGQSVALEDSCTFGAISWYRLLGRSGNRWCSIWKTGCRS